MWYSHEFIDPPQPQNILNPKNWNRYRRVREDYGPVQVANVSEGLRSYLWRLGFSDGWWYIFRTDSPEETAISLEDTGSLEEPEFADITWDNAGRPLIAWEVPEGINIFWYNTETSQFQTDLIVPQGKNPFCHLDYRNAAQNVLADIILTYERDNAVYYRIIGDRFTIEYPTPVTDLGKRRIFKAGVGTKLRYTICLA